jgi:hypothetical protein
MVLGDNSLQVIGVMHVATKNSVTVRVRILLADLKGGVYSFDADSTTWELQKLGIKDCPELHGVHGLPV